MLPAGCTPGSTEIFEVLDPPLVWPPAPAIARYRYVGQLRGAEDLKRPVGAFETLGRWITGPPPPAPLYGPRDVVCSPDGQRVCVADPGGRCLHFFDLARRRYHKIEKVGDEHLLTPVALCPGEAGSIFVCDSESAAIHAVAERDGRLQRTLRTPPELQRPAAVCYDATRRELYVVDVAAHDIKVLDPDGRLQRLIGRRGTQPGEFNYPCDIAADGETLWVVDAGNQRIQAISRSGEPLQMFGRAGDAPGDLALPKSIALDSTGHIYVVDARFENVQVFDRSGRLLLSLGEEGTAPGEFWLPAGLFIDARDRIWVCDSYNGRIQVFEYLSEAAAHEELLNNR